MTVGIARVTIFVAGSHSLKEKRMVVRRVKDLVRQKFNVAVAEVGENDVWQRAVIGLARVLFMVHGLDEPALERVRAGLDHASGYFRRAVAQRLRTRVSPEIKFEVDQVFERATHIEALLHDIGAEARAQLARGDEARRDEARGDEARGADDAAHAGAESVDVTASPAATEPDEKE